MNLVQRRLSSPFFSHMAAFSLSARCFSTAASIHSRFEEAYNKNKAIFDQKEKKQAVKNPFNAKSYWQSNKDRLKPYVHPYHTDRFPIVMTYHNYLKTLTEAVGPEQVSPHYESLSRSRRIVIFYFAWLSGTMLALQAGGWEYNDWIRACIYTQEFWLALLVGFIETRHFMFFLGPKFTIFYDTFVRYEVEQIVMDWQDRAEEAQNEYLYKVKEQLEYRRIADEYANIKRRSIANYLVSQRKALENSFHQRAQSMIGTIQRMEYENMNTEVQKQVLAAYESVKQRVLSEGSEGELQKQSFDSALDGIRKGKMDYALDPILPLFQEEVKSRTNELMNLSPQEESKLLSLTKDQRRIVAESDKKSKNEYLSKSPAVTNASLKANPKFREFVEKLQGGKA